jgi:heptosyltransferase-2/heptosyltransferase-3
MRIVFIRPCCIGDVVLATAALSALRAAYPNAHITWAVSSWARQAIDYHPAVDAILDTGKAELPVKSPLGFARFVYQLANGHFDVAVSLVRSPLMSLAVAMSGIVDRVGLDSNGRGFAYTLRVPVDPNKVRHEAKIYFDVVRAMGVDTKGYFANLPVLDEARSSVKGLLRQHGVSSPYIVVNPAGGSNPGMVMDSKRWPVEHFAEVSEALMLEYDAKLVLVAGPKDGVLVDALRNNLRTQVVSFVGQLSFPQIGALAANSLLYLGNDTGLTHLAAASGAKTAMILGPSSPLRYAPFTENSMTLWKAVHLNPQGVSASKKSQWDWECDGISVKDALIQLRNFLG